MTSNYISSKIKRAWLITWEWVGESAKVDDKVLAIMDYRLSYNTMRDYVERLYIIHFYTYFEQIDFAKYRSKNLYPARIVTDNHKRCGKITCGHNPYLLARFAYNLHTYMDENGIEYLSWDEGYLDLKNGERNLVRTSKESVTRQR